jgi:hypothetical protein
LHNEEIALEASLDIVEKSTFRANLHKQLHTVYEPLEIWYLRSSIEKAHTLDEPDFFSKPYLSSSLDDSFFILKKVLQRLVSTSSLNTHVRMCKEIKTIMERDYSDILRRRMEGVWSGISSSATAARNKEEATARQNFIVCLSTALLMSVYPANASVIGQVHANNLDTAADYLGRVVEELLDSDSIGQSYFLNSEYTQAKDALESVKELQDRFRASLKVTCYDLSMLSCH